ncbi:MAG: hypothetical protein M3P06_05350 [Acidobacteriota bacterium]|nr:hypothetical protein [Acidobacteriota bacterium]
MRGDDGVLDAVARWANLPLEDRIAERLAAILFAADEIRDMVALAGRPSDAAAFQSAAEQVHDLVQPLLPPLARLTDLSIERDPELEQMLLQLDGDLSRSHATRGKERDTWWEQIEQGAAPYALAFYYEIRRLDYLLLARSFAPARSSLDSQ